MPALKPLGQIIERVPALKKGKDVGYLQDTINLEESIKSEARQETVRLYYFAKTLKTAFEEILQAFSEPIGRGFWLTAEYGVGKSHFLATLACLLTDNTEGVWGSVHDKDIKNYRFHFQKRRLFPIVAGLRGKTAIAQDKPITLLEQLEKEIEESINQLGLDRKINVTPVAETLNLFDGFNASLQGAINIYIQQKSGKKPPELRKNHPDIFADLVRRFFKEQNLPFEPKVNINDRLQYLYKQIVGSNTGFNGLLFVIDEYESWLSQRPITAPEGMFDSNVLQALTEILPKQHGYEIFTVIASQTDIPAQLSGRFMAIPLLAGSDAARDYHVICAHRVRRYKPGMEGEAKLYYHSFYDEFAFYKSDTEESFLETFPFHPLAYETVRRFTSSVQDMPAVRKGLNIFYDFMKSDLALAINRPVTLHDVHKNSPNFEYALASPRFAESQRRYRDGLAVLPHIFPDEEERILAEAILTILYLQYVISGEQAIPMSAAELADATLTSTGAITGEQRILVILGEMSGRIPQLEFDSSHADKGARFIPKPIGPTPQQLLDDIKKQFGGHEIEIMDSWVKLLFAPLTETKGLKALFPGSVMDRSWKDAIVVNQISYEGEILVAGSWRADLGFPITDPNTHFRLVYLLNGSPSIASELQDSRIVVIEASPLSERLKDLCCTYLASKSLMKEFEPQNKKGPEAAEIRAFAETKFIDSLSTIIQYQLEPFQKGKAHTKEGINLDVGSSLSRPTPDQRHAAIVRPLLENAYREFPKLFDVLKIEKQIVPGDAKNLVLGLVQGDTTKAVRSTVEQKAVGLGLSMPNDPKTLNPQHSQFFKILDSRLSTNPALILWPLLKELAGCPYGIPPYLFTAMLLIYVRCRNVPTPVEIQLNPQHKLTNLSGKPLSKNLITRANVVELQWQSGMESFFDSLVVVSGPDWNSIQPYAKLLYPNAKPAAFPQEIDNQINGFLSFLKNQLPLVQSAAVNLKTLAEGLKDTLSGMDSEYLKKFADLYAADDLDTFDAQRKAIQPELPGFKSSAERVTALRQLAGISTQILQMLNALQMADVGTDEGLSAQKSMLLVRYKLSPMIGNETAVKALLNDTETFLLRVKNAQEIHAPRMMEILKKLKESLSGSSILLKGLGQLNQITTLGPPQGHDLASRLENLLNSVERELTGESNLHRSLSYNPPENEIRDIHNKIKEVFENRAAILRGQLEKVIQEKGKDQLKTLVHLIQINKLSEVATNLSPAIIGTIQKILEEARTQVVRSRVLEQVAEQFPAVGREDLDKFITELKTLLEKEFADKTQEGKKIILTFK
jgi:predicted transcriptional regulator